MSKAEPLGGPAGAEDKGKVTTGSEDKIRKDLVQVFFGLVLTQIAVYTSTLVDIWDGGTAQYWAAWLHMILAFFLTTTSWFGWQLSVRNTRQNDEASIFQGGFFLSLLDILLVGLYFLLIHKVEMSGVAAFPPPPETPSKVTTPNARPEIWIIGLIYLIYLLWDIADRIVSKKDYGPWPSCTCVVLVALALWPAYRSKEVGPYVVICLDAYLLAIVILFRAFKRLQKWKAHQRRDKSPNRSRLAPMSIRGFVYGLSFFAAAAYLMTLGFLYGWWGPTNP
jgi:hypothetical protein